MKRYIIDQEVRGFSHPLDMWLKKTSHQNIKKEKTRQEAGIMKSTIELNRKKK